MAKEIRVADIMQTPSLPTLIMLWTAVAQLTASHVALLVKLDADTALDDSDYVATLTPASQVVIS